MKSKFGNLMLLILIAVVSVTAVTYAWFSISDNTRLSNMKMDITTGLALRIDLDPHAALEDYRSSLSYSEISARILSDTGVDIGSVPMEPVTTSDGASFYFENGSPASYREGHYVEFTLHFISQGDMYVHLTSTPSKGADNGTRIWSDRYPTLASAMRISFTSDEGSFIYDPGEDDIEGLTDDNRLFFLPEETDKTVVVRVWMEGTDPNCNNDLKGSEYSLRMRFEGSDEYNRPLE